MKTFMRIACAVALACVVAGAQSTPAPSTAPKKSAAPARPAAAAKPAATSAGVTKALMQQVMDDWASLDMNKVAAHYSQAADNPYFDDAPLKYDNFAQYRAGFEKQIPGLASASVKVNDDAHVHNMGSWAWTTATCHLVENPKSGAPMIMEARWTAIWHKQGGKWIIQHDHFSVPLADTTPAEDNK